MPNGTAPRPRNEAGASDGAAESKGASQVAPDRRSHERFFTLFRLAKLIAGREEFCLVRNLSAGGLKVQIFSSKAVGDRLMVDFGDDQPLPARVAWVDDDNIGLSFDDQIDVAHALSKAAPPGRSRARPIRLAIALDAVARIGKVHLPCRLLDISQGGAKLTMESAPSPGNHMTLEIDGLGRLNCVVRWKKEGEVGVAFPGQLHYRQLAAWVGSLNPGTT